MTDEQILSPFDALSDEHALKLIHQIFEDRFGECDDASEAMSEATKNACFWIVQTNGYRDDLATDEMMSRVFGKPVKWWRDAA
jgi:hypothetical protein